MKKAFTIAFAAALCATPLWAADNTLVIDPGTTITTRSKDVGSGVQEPYVGLADTSGNAIYGTAGTANANVLSVQGIAGGTAVPISAASLPLASGAALSSKQPALGVAGTASTDVITVQGIASMTPLAGNLTQVGGTSLLTGTGAVGSGSPRVAVAVDSATVAGSAPGVAGAPSTQVVSVQGVLNGSALAQFDQPQTSGGYSSFFLQPAASDNHQNVKGSGGQVYHITAQNNSATVNYLRLYNAASGFNGCNSATNLVTQVQIAASTSVGTVDLAYSAGIPFSAGIAICVTSGYATNDTTNATATAMSLTILYK